MEAALFIKEKIDKTVERWQEGFHWKLEYSWELLSRSFVHYKTGERFYSKYDTQLLLRASRLELTGPCACWNLVQGREGGAEGAACDQQATQSDRTRQLHRQERARVCACGTLPRCVVILRVLACTCLCSTHDATAPRVVRGPIPRTACNTPAQGDCYRAQVVLGHPYTEGVEGIVLLGRAAGGGAAAAEAGPRTSTPRRRRPPQRDGGQDPERLASSVRTWCSVQQRCVHLRSADVCLFLVMRCR